MDSDSDSFRRWESFNFWTSPDKFWLEALGSKKNLVCISRRVDDVPLVSLEPYTSQSIPATASRRTVQGILGILELPLGMALIVVKRREKVGELVNSVVWRLVETEVIPLRQKSAASKTQVEAHKKCLAMVKEALSTPYFYFSYTSDLTNTQQRIHEQKSGEASSTNNPGAEAWRRLDRRFVWNEAILGKLLDASDSNEMHKFVLPIIHGAIFIQRSTINQKTFDWCILTRRSRLRTGTRFFSRGTDNSGNVSNFCETEFVVKFRGAVASYVQTRGSMPFVWEQVPCIKYMPMPKVTGSSGDNEEAFRAHFGQQVALYGEQAIVNLVNQTKYEGELERLFRKLVDVVHMDGVNYEPFDFHRECSKMRYERLVLLMDQLSHYRFGYFMLPDGPKTDPSNVQRQTGVFRTNCMDCLDRTNVVQSMLTSETLALILTRLNIVTSNSVTELERHVAFQQAYRNAWADNANLVSVQYAGTGALKTDYTRTGVRTRWGLLQDGWNASIRYYKNNFYDGFRTNAIQFFVGDLTATNVIDAEVEKSKNSSVSGMMSYLPFALLGCVILFLVTLLTSSSLNTNSFGLCVTSVIMAALFGTLIVQNNREFVDFPILFAKKRRLRLS